MIGKVERFFRVNQLPPYHLGEIAAAVVASRNDGRDIIDLSQFNPTESPPGMGVEKLVQAALQPHNHRYSASQGIARLRRATADWYAKTSHVDLDPDTEVVVTMGAKEAISHLMFALTSPGDTVLIPTPSYPIHTAAITLAGAGAIGVPLGQGGAVSPVLDESSVFFDNLEKAYARAWPRPIAMVVSFPHNPTTAIATIGFMERLVQEAKARSMFIIHDFAHADICEKGQRTPSILEVAGAKEVAVELRSLSKSLSIPGWRVGFCVGNSSLVASLKKIKGYLDSGIFQPIQVAAVTLLDNYAKILPEYIGGYSARRATLVKGLREARFEVATGGGTVFVWARIPEAHRRQGSLSFAKRAVHEAGVAVCPGIGFDQIASDFGNVENTVDEWLRFSLSESDSRIRGATAALEKL